MHNKLLIFGIVILLFASFGLGDLNNGLVSYYTFDDTGTDSLGRNDLTVTGATYGAAVNNNGILFDALNEKAQINSGLDWGGINTTVSGMTMCGWYNSTDGATAYQRVALFGKSAGQYFYGIQLRDNFDGNYTGWFNAAAGEDYVHFGVTRGNTTFYHLCLIYNSSGMFGYKDGSFVGSDSDFASSQSFTPTQLNFGQNTIETSEQFKGMIDEWGFWNRTLTEDEISDLFGGETYPFPFDTLNISTTLPANNTQFNTETLNLNGTVSSVTDFNCSLYINGTLNQTNTGYSAGSDVAIDFNLTFVEDQEDSYTYFFSCNDDSTEENSTTYLFYIDNVNPIITWNTPADGNTTLVNIYDNVNLTADIDLADWSLYSYYLNITDQDSTVLFEFSNTSLGSIATHTIDDVINFENHTGLMDAITKVCDGHTANNINFDAVVEGKELVFDDGKIRVYPDNPTTVNVAGYNRLPDRYSFDFTTKNPMVEQTFWVVSDEYIDIVQNSRYAGHMVSGNHWIDFEIDGLKDIVVQRVSDTSVKVVVTLDDPKQYWHFQSIGELNCVTETREVYVYNVTNSFVENVSILSTNNFNLTITPYNVTYLNVTDVQLDFNGTIYNITGSNGVYSQDIQVPSATSDYNMTFNWSYTVNGDNYTIADQIQKVFAYAIDNCSTYSTIAINFTSWNETAEALYNSTISAYLEIWTTNRSDYRAFNLSWGGNNTYGLCISPSWATYQSSIQLEYEGTGFDKKLYYWYNNTLNSTQQDVELYLTDGTTQVEFTVTDQDDNPVQDVYIKVLSYDLGTNSYKTTEILKTDTDGIALGQIVQNTKWYQFILEYEGEVVLTSQPTKITGTSKNFRIDLTSDFFERYTDVRGVTNTLTFNNETNNFAFTWSDASGTIHYACLKVIKRSINGDTLINDSCTLSTAGTILVNIGNNTGTNTYLATSYLKFDEIFILDSLTKTFNEMWKSYGSSGLFMSFMLIVSLIFIGVWSPIVAVLLMLVGLIMTNVWGILHIGWEILIALIIVGGITIYKLSK